MNCSLMSAYLMKGCYCFSKVLFTGINISNSCLMTFLQLLLYVNVFVFSAVYDVTIGYKYRSPSFLDNVFGVDPSEVHIHVRRIPIGDIPTSEDKISGWLMDRFHLKDHLLSNFYSQGHFPHEGTEGDLSTTKCLVNIVAVIVLTSTCMFFTFFSSIWFKMYVSLACAYLASATYFNIRPLPIVGLLKA